MSFVRFKLIVITTAILLLLARLFSAFVFYVYDDRAAFLILNVDILAIICVLICLYIVSKINLPSYLFSWLKAHLKTPEQSLLKAFYKNIYYFLAKHRLHDRSRLKNFLWYCFEIEAISICIVFVSLRGWGYGFEFFLIVIFTYFYMNFRYRAKRAYFILCAIAALYITLYLSSSSRDIYSPLQLWVYLINGTFALIMIFAIQIACELGKVIKVINDNNRHDYIRSLSSPGALPGTLAKYSFLDVASARLEHSPEDDIISQASVIFIEFSNFHAINQRHGMNIGDVAIKELAYLIQQICQNYDCYITHWSGNEFLVFLINEDEKIASMLAEQIVKEAALNRFSIRGIRVNLEVAIASENHFDYELGELIDKAIATLKNQKEE